jgi:hypothetical protein
MHPAMYTLSIMVIVTCGLFVATVQLIRHYRAHKRG